MTENAKSLAIAAPRRFRVRCHVCGVFAAVCLTLAGTARSACVVYDSGRASANAESTDTALTVTGTWDASPFGEIAVELKQSRSLEPTT